MRSQEQSAGPDSQQLQAGRDIHVHGVSSADVVRITRLEVERVLADLTLTAESVAKARAEAFERRILDRFEQNPDLRGAFADPDFQFSLRDAGRAAVSNDDKDTEDLLLELLANRAERGNHSRVRLATSHAIRAADKLSHEALAGLTAHWALASLTATESGVMAELRSAERVAQHLNAIGLPSDQLWLEDAYALNLVRLDASGLTTRKPYGEFFQHRVAADLVAGMEDARARSVVAASTVVCPELSALIRPHPLKPGFVALVGESQEDFLSRLPTRCRELPALTQLATDNGFGSVDAAAVAELDNRIRAADDLAAAAAWWNSLPPLQLTVVGQVIAFVKARSHIAFEGATTIAEFLTAAASR